MNSHHQVLELTTSAGLSLHDITADIDACVTAAGVDAGFVILTSRHTTTALMINENEARLVKDVQAFFERLVPAGDRYLHNDIALRDCDPDEPENAHAHLMAMLLGSSETIPVVNGALSLGQWQSVFLVELDGPRQRSVNVQVIS